MGYGAFWLGGFSCLSQTQQGPEGQSLDWGTGLWWSSALLQVMKAGDPDPYLGGILNLG